MCLSTYMQGRAEWGNGMGSWVGGGGVVAHSPPFFEICRYFDKMCW